VLTRRASDNWSSGEQLWEDPAHEPPRLDCSALGGFNALAALDPAGQSALRNDFEQLWAGNNMAVDGSTQRGN
jgi:hypothetical protein